MRVATKRVPSSEPSTRTPHAQTMRCRQGSSHCQLPWPSLSTAKAVDGGPISSSSPSSLSLPALTEGRLTLPAAGEAGPSPAGSWVPERRDKQSDLGTPSLPFGPARQYSPSSSTFLMDTFSNLCDYIRAVSHWFHLRCLKVDLPTRKVSGRIP